MERKKNRLICAGVLLALLFICHDLPAQKQYGAQIYQAYISGDMQKWERVISQLENSGTPTLNAKLELAEYYYAHIGYLLGMGKKEQAKAYLEKAVPLIDEVLSSQPDNASALSLKGTFVAYRMEMNKLKAPVLGPQCMRLIKKAYETDPGNIQAVSDLGNMYYHCPGLFGGDKALGIQYLRQAASLMEQRNQHTGNWFYLNLLTMLAQYEAESGFQIQARETYEKILHTEPGFAWVRDELYPQFLSAEF